MIYFKNKKRADSGSRTHDLLLTRQMLYQLSYTGYFNDSKLYIIK